MYRERGKEGVRDRATYREGGREGGSFCNFCVHIHDISACLKCLKKIRHYILVPSSLPKCIYIIFGALKIYCM